MRNGLLRCLAGSTWGAYTSTLRTGALALVYSAAEYASPVWSRSAHTGKLDVGLYDSMRIITGCMRPTETTFLPVLAGIVPPGHPARVAGCSPHENGDGQPESPSSTIVSQSLSLTPMNMNNVSSHVDLSPDTLPISSQTTMIHPRRGTTVLMLAHLSFDLPVPRPARRCRPVLTYRVSSGYDSTVFAPAPLASVRPSNFGACKKQHHVHVATRPRPWSTW